MTTRYLRLGLIMMSLMLAGAVSAADDHPYERQPHERMWEPVPDEVYLQEQGFQVATDSPVTSLAVHNDRLYAVVDGALLRLEGESLEFRPGAPEDIESIHALDGALWAITSNGLYQHAGNGWELVDDREFVDLCLHVGNVHAATRMEVFRYEDGEFVSIEPEGGYLSTNTTYLMEDFTQVLPRPVTFGPIFALESYSATLYGLGPNGRIVLFDGEHIAPDIADWGELPSPNVRDMQRLGSQLYFTTDRGVAVLRGMALTTLDRDMRLPYEDTTVMATGFDNDLWIGTKTGAIRMLDHFTYHYFGPDHWLPSNNVHAIASGDNVVYIGTDGGLGVIEYIPFTLRKKVDYYERHIDEWGHRRLGFIHNLSWRGDDLGWRRSVSDNDGGYTAHYLGAMSYKYAVTGCEEARERAVDTFKALAWLEEITPMDGFIARSIWSNDDDVGSLPPHGSGGLPAQWHETPDGHFHWKGDTSSDEVSAHYYGMVVFHDLAARGAEKDRAAEHLERLTRHIIENGWVLRDIDGTPTRWGRWDPEYLQRPYGNYIQGLNGMQAQMFALTAYALTGDEFFRDGFEQLIEWRYHHHTVQQKRTFPPQYDIPWDDRLAFLTYYPLLRYTEDAKFRSIYMRSIERNWEIRRREYTPWYNFVYSIATGNDGDTKRAVEHLREWPLDLENHRYTNSHRYDLDPLPDEPAYGKGTRGMSPRETQAKQGYRSALPRDGGGGGSITHPAGFVEDYWMGRYYGFIAEPEVDDPELVSVERTGEQRGAPPYEGAPRHPISGVDD